jgi:hypothetical protein
MVFLFHVALMSPSMEGQLASLSEALIAAINTTDKWSFLGVSVLVFLQILIESKFLAAVSAREFLHLAMDKHVSGERELGCEFLGASGGVAFVGRSIFNFDLHLLFVISLKSFQFKYSIQTQLKLLLPASLPASLTNKAVLALFALVLL